MLLSHLFTLPALAWSLAAPTPAAPADDDTMLWSAPPGSSPAPDHSHIAASSA